MKKLISSIMLTAFIATSSFGSVFIEYYNRDSETHIFDVRDGGDKRKVEFGSSRTSAVTIQCGSSKCIITTKCGDIEINTKDKIEIKDGCIKIK